MSDTNNKQTKRYSSKQNVIHGIELLSAVYLVSWMFVFTMSGNYTPIPMLVIAAVGYVAVSAGWMIALFYKVKELLTVRKTNLKKV